jgi:D-alanine transaminase
LRSNVRHPTDIVFNQMIRSGDISVAEPLVYLNGQVVAYEEATIPVEDRGLQFADGVYEVVRYYDGHPFRMTQHLARLVRSAAGLELDLPSLEALQAAMNSLVERQGFRDATVYLQITRGAAPRQHGLIEGLSPTVIAIARPAKTVRPRPALKAVTTSDDRWARCYLKTTSLLPNAMARERAKRMGADDAIFVRDGFVMEASASNVFAVFGDRLVTPPLTNYILAGITRDAVLEVAAASGIKTSEEPISAHLIYSADEVFITGTNSELGPVVEVDGRRIGTGEIGPVFERILAAFDASIRASQPATV